MEARAAEQELSKSIVESYVQRASYKPFTQWILGAMQAVDKQYTDISVQEAARVGEQLKKGLAKKGIGVEFRLQGSVPCDVHIRGASDVDLLVITKKFWRYDSSGTKAKRGYYSNPVDYCALQALVEFREQLETVATTAFPEAVVEIENSKAIALSGGSFQRKVDAVPANWFDSDKFQESESEADRGIEILDKKIPKRIRNLPFKHIVELDTADKKTKGGLKKAIRLLKNIKAEAEENGEEIKLTSYDIASFMWHADKEKLATDDGEELKLLAEVTSFVTLLLSDRMWAKELSTPNGTTKIFENDSKFDGLTSLSNALNEYVVQVAVENPNMEIAGSANINEVLNNLKNVFIPV
ncbi:hypothetical protein BV899_17390 [Alcaligenes phenolicus]|nr:hypothetical protein BV899_17390 [Alcaligenes phenolicus]